MKISIVTPSYNQSRFLEKTILSVWTQEGDFELEHIVIDGGSSDSSIEILLKYDHLYKAQLFPFRCKRMSFSWESKPDRGQADAINKGFAISSGDILGWLNSDDLFFDDSSLQKIGQSFKNNNADLIVGNVEMIDEAIDINKTNKTNKINKMINTTK